MDWTLAHDLNGLLWHHDGLEDLISGFERYGEVLFIAALVLLGVLGGPLLRRGAVAAAASVAVALAVGQVIARLVDRPRPFVAHAGQVHLFAPHAADSGFPSDHAIGAFAIAGAVLAYDRRWGVVLLVLGALLAAGRVAIGVHYPTDVLAGAALGLVTALAITRGPARAPLNRLSDRLPERRPAARVAR